MGEGHHRKVCFMGKTDAATETVKQIIKKHFLKSYLDSFNIL